MDVEIAPTVVGGDDDVVAAKGEAAADIGANNAVSCSYQRSKFRPEDVNPLVGSGTVRSTTGAPRIDEVDWTDNREERVLG